MFRRSALPAAASLAVVLLAVTGCKIQVSGAAPGGTSTAGAVAGTSGVTRSGPLIVEPGAGFSPVYSLINGARHSIDVTRYEFSGTTAEHDLAAAAKRGVRVRVILDRRARSVNADAYSYLRSHRVAVTWSSPDYHYTHQKTVIIDGTKAVIMPANLTSRYYATSRDPLVVGTERADVSAITTVFDADFKKKAVRPGDGRDLVWSPTDSQDHLIGLIISYYRSSTGFYIHGKVVEADYGTEHGKIFVGSENFSNTSLNQNRELGLIISGHAVMSAIAGTSATDFRNGRHWSAA
jgi:cardiolipin synthase